MSRSLRAVFVGGCPRSGTTLQRTMLNSHPGLAIPHVVEEGGAWLHAPLRDRFERTLAGARLAVTLGYYDQAHLVREFTATIGTAPARYARRVD